MSNIMDTKTMTTTDNPVSSADEQVLASELCEKIISRLPLSSERLFWCADSWEEAGEIVVNPCFETGGALCNRATINDDRYPPSVSHDFTLRLPYGLGKKKMRSVLSDAIREMIRRDRNVALDAAARKAA